MRAGGQAGRRAFGQLTRHVTSIGVTKAARDRRLVWLQTHTHTHTHQVEVGQAELATHLVVLPEGDPLIRHLRDVCVCTRACVCVCVYVWACVLK